MSRAPSEPAPAAAAEELGRLQAAEEAKADPALDEVEPADIDVADERGRSRSRSWPPQARRLSAERVRTHRRDAALPGRAAAPVEEIRQATGLEPERLEKALDEALRPLPRGVCGSSSTRWPAAGSCAPRRQLGLRPPLPQVKPQRLTRAALETLAIIAYRQPVTRPEVEEIRGVDCGAVVKALLERKLIKILGKKEEPGRPILYGTTREFLEFFASKDLASLPTLREFHELSEEHREIVEQQAPAEADSPAWSTSSPTRPARRAGARRAESDAALDELERAMGGPTRSAPPAAARRTRRAPPDEDPAP